MERGEVGKGEGIEGKGNVVPRPLDPRLCLFARIPRESRKIALGDKRTAGFSWDGWIGGEWGWPAIVRLLGLQGFSVLLRSMIWIIGKWN